MCILMEFVVSCPAVYVFSVIYDGGPLVMQQAYIIVAFFDTPPKMSCH